MDYRLKENRRESFIRWYYWSLKHYDADPAIYLTNYLFDRFEHNTEQKLWICWLYGTTYHFPATWVIWNEFPDFELVGKDRLKIWNDGNYKRLRYQTDTKYNKGFLPQQFDSYKAWIHKDGHKTQRAKFESLYADNEIQTFQNIWESVNELYKFGRYTSWFYIQALAQCAGIKADAPTLMLNDYGGSRSHRNGLCYALGKDEWYDEKLTKAQYDWLEGEAASIIAEMKERFPDVKPEPYTMETCLCSYKKIFRVKDGRYLGYYLDRQAEEIAKVQNDGWVGIDWQPLWDARTETLLPVLAESKKIHEEKMASFLETGRLDRLNYVFKDEQPVATGALTEFFT